MATTLGRRVAAVREFNRFYTSRIGVLDEGYLSSRFSLTAVRVLYELAHHGSITATELGRNLRLDAGYVSRMVRGFARRGLLARTGAKDDGRKTILRLTARGRATVAPLEARARDQIAAMLRDVPSATQDSLVASMHAIERTLQADREGTPRVPFRARGRVSRAGARVERCARRGAPDLRARGLRARRERTSYELREATGRTELALAPLAPAPRAAAQHADVREQT